jgi:transketolase
MSTPTSIGRRRALEPAGPPDSDRAAYRVALLELAKRDERIWCLDSDMGGLEKQFEAELPDQYVDVGIAEANLMSMAAAVASAGLVPFANTMAAFASARALEQVKIDIAYHRLPVRIVATHSGFSAAHLGPTHHAQQDLAVMRSMPNMTVLTPADVGETIRMIDASAYLPGPVYVRLGRSPIPAIYPEDSAPEFTIGQAVGLRAGADVTIVAAGALPVRFAVEAAAELAAAGISARVLNMHTIKPLDTAAIVAAAEQTGGLVTVEDHSVLGGLGGAVAETLAEEHPARLRRVGIADAFCPGPGTHAEQLAAAGVSTAHVVAAARAVLRT